MALSFERPWQFAINTAPSDNSSLAKLSASFFHFMKNMYLGLVPLFDINNNPIAVPAGKWTLLGTSNGATAGMDGVDRLGGATFTFADWVSATAGSAHTWWVVQSPDGKWCIIFDYSSGSGVNFFNLICCHTAPTGGSITARPTSVDETGALTNQQINDGTFITANTFHGILSTSGDVALFGVKNGQGFANACMITPLFGQTHGISDVVPWATFYEYSVAAPGAPDGSFFSGAPWLSRNPDNSGASGTSATFNVGRIGFSNFGNYDTAFPNTGDAIDGTIPKWPVPLASYSASTGSHLTQRGRLVDIQPGGLAGANVQNGTVDPLTGTPKDAMVVGACIFPTNLAPQM